MQRDNQSDAWYDSHFLRSKVAYATLLLSPTPERILPETNGNATQAWPRQNEDTLGPFIRGKISGLRKPQIV